ncbi:MAG: hypothetical protein Q6365_022590, partial [Candidatus Sigynarchaeota archaeon]
MERNAKAIIVVACIAAVVMPIGLVAWDSRQQTHQDTNFTVIETSGTWETWASVFSAGYRYRTDLVATSGGNIYTTYTLVPDGAALPFTPVPGASVVVYETSIDGITYWCVGYKAAGGWWLVGWPFETRDPAVVDHMT